MDDHPQAISVARALEALAKGSLALEGAMPFSSNYTLLARVEHEDVELLAIYKPRRGERPLWDFPKGTLYRREAAAYVVSECLGFGLVPPTVVRDGPYGVGMVQLYIANDEDAHLFTMLKEGGYELRMRQMCVFDYVINNADRKSGHGLKGLDGRLWAIDHGICFHYELKLRTVLWDFMGEPLGPELLTALCHLRTCLDTQNAAVQLLDEFLAKAELRALRRRIECLISSNAFPDPGPGPNVPWPPV
ncbi:MAG: SCO1664 family protein [Candidatus Viridilinea halotolerans]|uniref:SCO1664 family protein n=1 Tax=Candidatus Viridilinea halotolerans TaxID=2491704 RepID=A0A426U9B8_9CHLR|nr:MAG: SCO1664 family protein [Candidatus Viridilinea halotolerans]